MRNTSLLILIVMPLLFGCTTNPGDSTTDITSESILSEDSSFDTTSSSKDSSSSSTVDYQGYDGYQYDINPNESDYWYNTGLNLPIGVNYHQSNILETLQRGDIVFEATGFYGITGHVAIVEGIYYSETYQQYFVRLIEAISVGVARSILTPSRMIAKEDSVYRVRNATSTQIDNAIDFIIAQLGKPYSVQPIKNANADNPDWYCSELIWAGYYHQGIYLDVDDNDNYGSPITPREMIESNLLSRVAI
ncbi:MAG: YiiX/YebB-like N1pC/P60 family cysteine hydrolase [Desulfobacterales bacterium]|nr:YiiX/YebB-like N1pC/P60 family cysteine hydrolase [Desulfobacterales bacterium]